MADPHPTVGAEGLNLPKSTTVYDVLMARCTSNMSSQPQRSPSSQHCCVPLCTSDSRSASKEPIWFHTFPQKDPLKKVWLVKIRRDEGSGFKVCHTCN